MNENELIKHTRTFTGLNDVLNNTIQQMKINFHSHYHPHVTESYKTVIKFLPQDEKEEDNDLESLKLKVFNKIYLIECACAYHERHGYIYTYQLVSDLDDYPHKKKIFLADLIVKVSFNGGIPTYSYKGTHESEFPFESYRSDLLDKGVV